MSNRGITTLKCRSSQHSMRDFDRLNPELRQWVAGAVLPWRAASVKAAYDKALKQTGDPARAMAKLDEVQARLVAKDAARIEQTLRKAG